MGISLWVFGGYHLNLIKKGISTTEWIKLGNYVCNLNEEFQNFLIDYEEKKTKMTIS